MVWHVEQASDGWRAVEFRPTPNEDSASGMDLPGKETGRTLGPFEERHALEGAIVEAGDPEPEKKGRKR